MPDDDLNTFERGVALGKLKLWFFRDCNQEQRNKFFSLFGLPPVTSLETQRFVLGRIITGNFKAERRPTEGHES